MTAIWIALIASLAYGISSPIAKIAFNKGMHADGFVLSYALGLLTISGYSITKNGIAGIYPNTSALVLGLIAGALCAIGFKANATALSIPTSLVAVVMVIVATYPLFSSTIGLTLLGEASKVFLPKLIIGIVMVLGGGYLASTSIR